MIHVMNGADVVRASQVAAEQLQKRAQALGPAGRERNDDRQLRDLTQRAEDVLQRPLAYFRRVGEQFPQLVDLVALDAHVCRGCVRCHGCRSLSAVFRSHCRDVRGPSSR